MTSTQVLGDYTDEQMKEVQTIVRNADKQRRRQGRKLMNLAKAVAGSIDMFPKRRKFRIFKHNLIAQVI